MPTVNRCRVHRQKLRRDVASSEAGSTLTRMADYPSGACTCCHRTNAIFGPTRVPDGLPTSGAPAVCGRCTRHLGDHPTLVKKREKEHFELWAVDASEAAEEAARQQEAAVARVQSHVDELQAELQARPVRVVIENPGQEKIDQAYQDRQKAFALRDRAFRVLSAVHLLHHDVGGDECSCGTSLRECSVAQEVDGNHALKGWERKQWERKRDGLPHLLPAGHPGVIDYRWEPDQESAVGAEDFPDADR